jgi:hypothetical protein
VQWELAYCCYDEHDKIKAFKEKENVIGEEKKRQRPEPETMDAGHLKNVSRAPKQGHHIEILVEFSKQLSDLNGYSTESEGGPSKRGTFNSSFQHTILSNLSIFHRIYRSITIFPASQSLQRAPRSSSIVFTSPTDMNDPFLDRRYQCVVLCRRCGFQMNWK